MTDVFTLPIVGRVTRAESCRCAGDHEFTLVSRQGGVIISDLNPSSRLSPALKITFLGAGQQTARQLIDQGAIGTPIGGTAFVLLPGHERWHPTGAALLQIDADIPRPTMNNSFVRVQVAR